MEKRETQNSIVMLISDNIQIKIYEKNNFSTIIYALSESMSDLLIELRFFKEPKT